MSLFKFAVNVIFLFLSILVEAKKITREPQQVGGDVGMRGIEVNQVDLQRAVLGSSVSFKGSEAISLYEALPKNMIADNPEDSAGFIVQDGKTAVVVKCVKRQIDHRTKQFVPVKNGARCEVQVKQADPSRNQRQEMKWIN